MNEYLSPIYLSLKCGILSALINLPWGIFWGWIFARKNFKGKLLVQALLYIPLVLPPILTGYLLLVVLSKQSVIGSILYNMFNICFVLDWKGAVIASSVVSSPFMILIVKSTMEKIDKRFEIVARTLGASYAKVFWTIILPLSWNGIVAGFFIVFARSIGEFGATIMLAGNIPLKTQTIPLAIYSNVYLGQEEKIIPLVVISIVFSYAGLVFSYMFSDRR